MPVFEVEDISCIIAMLGGIETAWVGSRMVHGGEDLPSTSLLLFHDLRVAGEIH